MYALLLDLRRRDYVTASCSVEANCKPRCLRCTCGLVTDRDITQRDCSTTPDACRRIASTAEQMDS